MFRGNHPTRVDEKGRLKLPAEFKRRVEEVYGPLVSKSRSMDGKRATDLSAEGVEEIWIEESLKKNVSHGPGAAEVSGCNEFLRADGGTRRAAVIPQKLARWPR